MHFELRSLFTVPFKGVLALRSEVVDVGFKVEFEDVVFVDVLRLGRDGDGVAQQGEAGQRVVVLRGDESRGQQIINHQYSVVFFLNSLHSYYSHLVRLVEEEAEVGEHHPELLPAVTVLKLPQQVT